MWRFQPNTYYLVNDAFDSRYLEASIAVINFLKAAIYCFR